MGSQRTKFFIKTKCDELITISNNQLPIVGAMTKAEITSFINSNDLNIPLDIIGADPNSPESFQDVLTEMHNVTLALADNDIVLAKKKLTEMLNLIISGCNEFIPEITENAFKDFFNFISYCRFLKHFDFPSSQAVLIVPFALSLAFFTDYAGDLHIPRTVIEALETISPISTKGLSVTSNCVIIDIQILIKWAKDNAAYIPQAV